MKRSKFRIALWAFVLTACAVFAFWMTFTVAGYVPLFYVLFAIVMIPSVLLLLRGNKASKDGEANG